MHSSEKKRKRERTPRSELRSVRVEVNILGKDEGGREGEGRALLKRDVKLEAVNAKGKKHT